MHNFISNLLMSDTFYYTLKAFGYVFPYLFCWVFFEANFKGFNDRIMALQHQLSVIFSVIFTDSCIDLAKRYNDHCKCGKCFTSTIGE